MTFFEQLAAKCLEARGEAENPKPLYHALQEWLEQSYERGVREGLSKGWRIVADLRRDLDSLKAEIERQMIEAEKKGGM